MAARFNVIVLDQPNGDSSTYRYCLWANVPVARQSYYVKPSFTDSFGVVHQYTSAWSGATAADNTALQNGSVSEKVDTMTIPAGTTLAQVEAWLQARWNDYQNYINNWNPWIHYGSTWDGTTWNVVTGA